MKKIYITRNGNKFTLTVDDESNLSNLLFVLGRLEGIANECFGSWLTDNVFYMNTANGATPKIVKRFFEYQFRKGTFYYIGF